MPTPSVSAGPVAPPVAPADTTLSPFHAALYVRLMLGLPDPGVRVGATPVASMVRGELVADGYTAAEAQQLAVLDQVLSAEQQQASAGLVATTPEGAAPAPAPRPAAATPRAGRRP